MRPRIFSDRQELEKYLGNSDVIPRPPKALVAHWDAHSQAEFIITRVRDALETNSHFISITDGTAAIKFNRSALGYPLRGPSKQHIVLTAAKILANDAGLNPDDVRIQKEYHPPAMYVVLPNEDTARQLKAYIYKQVIQKAELK